MVSVLIILKSPLLRDALRQILRDAEFSVLEEADDVESALRWLKSFPLISPDLVIVDATLCIERSDLLSVIRECAGQARIALLAYDADINTLSGRHLMAADGVLTFGITAEAMVSSLHLIQKGERVVPRELMQAILAQAGENGAKPAPVSRLGRSQTPSPREAEILRHLLQGDSNKMIARELGITEATVKVHLKGLLRKISASNRTQAAIWALNHGYNIEPQTSAFSEEREHAERSPKIGERMMEDKTVANGCESDAE
jgi:two-component system nitrate/nitrite response regulator NarL